MSKAERVNIANAIWLCSNCAAAIDRDVVAHPAPLLLDWRKLAEEKARAEQGRRLATDTDATDQLMMAFTGSGRKFVPTAISNTHRATSAVLEMVDPRFRIETSFVNGSPVIGLHARENVPFVANIAGDSAEAWAAGLRDLVEHGKQVVLPMDGVTFTGSPIFDALAPDRMREQGKLTITPHGRPAVVKLAAQNSSELHTFDDIPGQLFRGERSLRFEGSCCNNLVKILLVIERLEEDGLKPGISIDFDLSGWEGVDVLQLPYFEKLRLLVKELNREECHLQLSFEVDGNVAFRGTEIAISRAAETFLAIDNFLGYTARARTIATRTGTRIRLKSERGFSEEDHRKLADAADMFEGLRVFDRECISTDPEITVVVKDEGRQLRSAAKDGSVREWKVKMPAEVIDVFGVAVTLPPHEVRISDAHAHILRCKKVSDGHSLIVRLKRGPQFRWECVFAVPKAPDALTS